MDNKRERLLNWIEIPLSFPVGRLTETFYFDKKTNLFFSIHIIDFFMLNEDYEIAEDVTTSYNKETENDIASWMKRILNEDKQIIEVPQKGLTDETLKKIEAEKFLNGLSIDLDKAEIWEVEISNSIQIDLTKEQGHSREKE